MSNILLTSIKNFFDNCPKNLGHVGRYFDDILIHLFTFLFHFFIIEKFGKLNVVAFSQKSNMVSSWIWKQMQILKKRDVFSIFREKKQNFFIFLLIFFQKN